MIKNANNFEWIRVNNERTNDLRKMQLDEI